MLCNLCGPMTPFFQCTADRLRQYSTSAARPLVTSAARPLVLFERPLVLFKALQPQAASHISGPSACLDHQHLSGSAAFFRAQARQRQSNFVHLLQQLVLHRCLAKCSDERGVQGLKDQAWCREVRHLNGHVLNPPPCPSGTAALFCPSIL